MPYPKKLNNIYLLLLGICIIFFIPYFPPFVDLCYDGGVFQYMGMLLDNGQLPYTDAFDHKPPVIFILNYLGFQITPNSIWGIFFIFSFFTYIASILIYKAAFKRTNNKALSILFSAIFIGLNYNSSILEDYNLTRQFTSWLTLYILYILFDTERSKLSFSLIGSLLGIIFFTQQNEVLAIATVTLYGMFFSEKWNLNTLKTIVLNCSYLALGLLVSFGALGLIIYSWGNFNDFIDQAFLFNLNKYIGDDTFWDKLIRTISRFFVITGKLSGVLLVTLLFIIYNLVTAYKKKITLPTELKVISIGLLIQLLASSISGRAFGHYFLMFIPFLMYILMLSYRTLSAKMFTYTKYAIVFVVCFQAINRLRKIESNTPFYTAVNNEVSTVKGQTGQFYPFNPRYLRVNCNWSIKAPAHWIYNHTAFLDHFPEGKIFNDIINDLKKHKTKYILTDSTRGIDPGLQVLLNDDYIEVLSDDKYFKLYKRQEK